MQWTCGSHVTKKLTLRRRALPSHDTKWRESHCRELQKPHGVSETPCRLLRQFHWAQWTLFGKTDSLAGSLPAVGCCRCPPLRQYLVMDAHMTWCGPVSRSYEFYRAVHETLSLCSLVISAFSPAAPCSFKIDAAATSKVHVILAVATTSPRRFLKINYIYDELFKFKQHLDQSRHRLQLIMLLRLPHT